MPPSNYDVRHLLASPLWRFCISLLCVSQLCQQLMHTYTTTRSIRRVLLRHAMQFANTPRQEVQRPIATQHSIQGWTKTSPMHERKDMHLLCTELMAFWWASQLTVTSLPACTRVSTSAPHLIHLLLNHDNCVTLATARLEKLLYASH